MGQSDEVYIHRNTYLGVIWALVAIDVLFTIARLAIRITKVGKLLWDDAAHCLGLMLLLASAILTTVSWPLFYVTRGISTGGTRVTAEYIIHGFRDFEAFQLPLALTYFACLMSIKLAFLLFYKKFFKDVQSYLIAWWAVLAFSLSTWAVLMVMTVFVSGTPKDFFNPLKQLTHTSQFRITFQIIFAVVSNVLSDLMIMALPIRLIWNLQINRKQKIGLGIIFSLVTIIIIFSLIRAISTFRTFTNQATTASELYYNPGKKPDPIWLNFWSNLEISVAVFVSTLPSFRLLFRKQPVRTPRPVRHDKLQSDDSRETGSTPRSNDPKAKGLRRLFQLFSNWSESSFLLFSFRKRSGSQKSSRISPVPEANENTKSRAGWRGMARLGKRNERGALDSVMIPGPAMTMIDKDIEEIGGQQDPVLRLEHDTHHDIV